MAFWMETVKREKVRSIEQKGGKETAKVKFLVVFDIRTGVLYQHEMRVF